MKRLILLVILACLVPVLVFSQTGDVRTRGMGGAFTAVADDLSAMYMNPAGLGYLDHTTLLVGLGLNMEMKKSLVFSDDDLPWPWEEWREGGMYYSYWDDFLGTDVFFDPSLYGFSYDPEDNNSYVQAVQAYFAWREAYGFFEFADSTSNIYLLPRVAYAANSWGFSTISETAVDFGTDAGYFGEDTPIDTRVSRKQGLLGAIGLDFGPLGVGASLKYYKNTSYVLSYSISEFSDGPPDSFLQQVFFGPEDGNFEQSEGVMELGIGGLFTLGELNIGAYLDNLLFFLGESEDKPGLLDSLSVGFAWMPSYNRVTGKRSPLNLIAALDLRNIGSLESRELSAGLEVGLNLGRAFMINGRTGYAQGLAGPLGEAFSTIDLYQGTYSLGFGFKFLAAELNVAFTFPPDMLFDPPQGNRLPEERLDSLFGTGIAELRIDL
ncbi:MAG: hypothetical protein ABIJ86_12110 [Spirochaetota bacterium]